jgi:hypothetical protein
MKNGIWGWEIGHSCPESGLIWHDLAPLPQFQLTQFSCPSFSAIESGRSTHRIAGELGQED